MTDCAATLKKGSADNENLLNRITESNFVHQDVLDGIENKLANKEKVQEVKDMALQT